MVIFETEVDFGMDIPEEIWKNCKTLEDIYLGFIKGRYAKNETN
jgi:acyl carrier protein